MNIKWSWLIPCRWMKVLHLPLKSSWFLTTESEQSVHSCSLLSGRKGVTSVTSDRLTAPWWSSFQDLPAESEQSTLVHYSVVGGVTSVISDRLTAPWESSFQDLPAESEQSTLVHYSVAGRVLHPSYLIYWLLPGGLPSKIFQQRVSSPLLFTTQ